jgi:hypothetical protein
MMTEDKDRKTYWRHGAHASKEENFMVARDGRDNHKDLYAKRTKPFLDKAGITAQDNTPVRSSQFRTLNECPRKYFYQYRLGLQLKGWRSKALDIGTFYHAILEQSYMGLEPEEAITEASRLLTLIQEDLSDLSDASGYLPDGATLESVSADLEQNFSVARVMYELTAPRFIYGPLLKDWKPIAVETPIEVNVCNLACPLRVKPDVIVEHREEKRLMIIDHKTTSNTPASTMAGYRWSFQTRTLLYAVRQAFPDHDVDHIVHNVVQKPTIKYPSKRSPTWDAYLENCQTWYKEQELKNPDDPPIQQSLIRFPQEIMDYELWTMITECSRAGSMDCLNASSYYRNSSSCAKWGRLCPYYSLCEASLETWPDIINRLYEQHFREDNDE